ncbi:MAG: peptidase S8 [Candidatus Tumulicola sp.]
MNHFIQRAMPIAAMFAIAACSSNAGTSTLPSGSGAGASLPAGAHSAPMFPMSSYHPACSGSRVNQAQCDALVGPAVRPDVAGITAPEILQAYNLKPTGGKGQIVAIVDAYDNPNAASDLAAYRSYFNIPAATFTKYNQTGQTSNYPAGNSGWGLEEDLDIEMVSVGCPACTIYLVEANSNNNGDLSAAEAEAVKLGATVVSNSYDGGPMVRSDFDQPGITYVASAGDAGYGINYPASYDSVVSVGGTVLLTASGKRGYSETIWRSSGAGCSSEAKPTWQKDPGCTNRTANDVSAVAQEVAMYDTYSEGGWFTVAGTSISAPLIGGIFGEAGNSTKQNGGKKLWTKKAQKHLYPVLVGSDGSCNGSYLCTAGTGQYGNYSGPGGWGSPNGYKAF